MKKGQALITLLIFILIAITISSSSMIILLLNSQGIQKNQQGTIALHIAESGVENALLRLLRNPNYTGEEDLPVGEGNVTITVSGSPDKTIISTGKTGNFIRKIRVITSYHDNALSVDSWKEIF
ncbi:hypothetical protein A3C23_01465 [Candidatus Roizmanbacteria bacterium RIFCSPHIGHO2_02_FULL_37_13b]|uniref:Type 4 fimbrial biogenesis protein PilX N-terminal domain-containing protein n=1 Tax=Candidatus Roizmanbacteria bacterium RIFCSPLOWO2_02_FULL_36_11 TaxID=1802071 RepID=A0A1F7JIG7_9BACT|nr:MAG: hypothetical protein A3C23_01465 [Candidatus Roizmanbacteria bacterium RIFCSPHIGHO2_02_FULL_37_13b]OGK55406.1 MAG: hypothetical protein A3H78_05935 [Candidatus Roizmanbacteria bacterium RIFCSPLOWO2_02_FULL_36_11]